MAAECVMSSLTWRTQVRYGIIEHIIMLISLEWHFQNVKSLSHSYRKFSSQEQCFWRPQVPLTEDTSMSGRCIYTCMRNTQFSIKIKKRAQEFRTAITTLYFQLNPLPGLRSIFKCGNVRFSRIVVRIISPLDGTLISSVSRSKTPVAMSKVSEFQGLRSDKPIRVN